MAQRARPWHICDDCLDPLAYDLLALAAAFHRHFDVTKADRLSAEYQRMQLDSACSSDQLGGLLERMGAQTEPPCARDVDSLYKKYDINMAIDWLRFNISVEYADDFERRLLDAEKRFSALEFKACQIINGDLGKETTTWIPYSIQRLKNRHYELLRESFPNREPNREELPDGLREFEVEILDEYTRVEQLIRETGRYLFRVSALIQAKMKKADGGDIQRQTAEGLQAGLAGRDYTHDITEVAECEAGKTADKAALPRKAKRSTERGEGQAKLAAALNEHHQYNDGSFLNQEPAGNNELARLAQVSESTASAFFSKQFGGHIKYRSICSDKALLIAALKLLNKEFAPHHLFGAEPLGEDEQ